MPEHVQNEKAVMDNRSRLKEMRDILLKYKVVTRGITPEKLRNILEELGHLY